MRNTTGHIIISKLRSKWRLQELFVLLLVAIAIAVPVVIVIHVIYQLSPWWLIPLTLTIFAAGVAFSNRWKLQERDVARILNQNHPELQESTALLLKPADQLGLLEKLQVQKISVIIQQISSRGPVIRKIQRAGIGVVAAVGFATLFFFAAPSLIAARSNAESNTAKKPAAGAVETMPPSVSSILVKIQPPAYTGRAARTQQRFNIRAEQGSILTWELITKGDATRVELVFNDSTSIQLASLNKAAGNWVAERIIKNNGYYQVKIGNIVSELYQLEVIADQQPVITVQTPRPATIIEYGQSQQVPLSVTISDDYGVSSTGIVATIATGNGEAVKFKEQRLAFNSFQPGGTKHLLTKTFSLTGMGMQPGDELYFYISATDNNRQETRSDIYTIKIEDTAALMSMDGIMSGVDVKPEFFRSQRQIIIETEQLLKGRDTMSKEAFNNRCNDLGIDQKLLRLRYGKFLGEESETNIGEDGNTGHDEHQGGEKHEDKDGHTEEVAIEDFNNAEKIIDRFSHKHDIAEDATFFDPETKKELRATLAEMWKAELQLRTYKATDALPFEYKALRLLKELQQKSREYVAKTSTKTTPLKPEKRLTGELDKIVETKNKAQYQAPPDKAIVLRKALAILNQRTAQAFDKSDKTAAVPMSASEKEIIEDAAGQLSLRASAEPATYLRAFEAIKKLSRNEPADPVIIEKAIQKMLQPGSRLPGGENNSPDMNLSKEYFLNLSKPARRS